MIFQTFIVIFILSVSRICEVIGASYSNVYVESEVVPMAYYSYGTPYPSIANPRLSQINSLPSVPGNVAPCVSPCVYPAQTVATVTPVNPTPNVLTYNAPSVPIVVAPTKQDATGYEYSYVVYDENTGDQKAQRELSDGSVVRGEYSFLQPDGYVRQVQYVADDISGFNAVVKQFLPAVVEPQITSHRKVKGQENKESSSPCHEIKNESLKEESGEDSRDNSTKTLTEVHEKIHNNHSNKESSAKSNNHHGTSKESAEEENSNENHHKKTKKVSKEESGEESEARFDENQTKKPKHSKEASGEDSEEKSQEKSHIKPKHSKEESGEEYEEKSIEKHNKSKKVFKADSGEKSEEKSKEETLHKKSNDSTGESKEKHDKIGKKESKKLGEQSEEETGSEESKEELKEKSRKKSSKGTDESREKNKKKSKKGSKKGSDEDSGEEFEEVGHGKHKEVYGLLKPNQEAHALLKPNQEVLVPYNDILRCIEAAMRRNYEVPAAIKQEPSPLTYIVLNKPC